MRRFRQSPLVRGVLMFMILLGIGTLGYMVIDDYSFMDGLFMTVITVTTVGYGEVRPLSQNGEIFTIFLLFISLLFVSYIVGYMTSYLVSGVLQQYRLEKKISKNLRKMKDHTIICGYGEHGQKIAHMLAERAINVVVIENDDEKLKDMGSAYINPIHADASQEKSLISASVTTAQKMIVALPDDGDTLYTVLAARSLNPDLFIIARTQNPQYVGRLKLAGANEVLLPSHVTGKIMAELVLAPRLKGYMDEMILRHNQENGLGVLSFQDCHESWSDADLGELLGEVGHLIATVDKEGNYFFEATSSRPLSELSSCLILADRDDMEVLTNKLNKKRG